MQTFGFLAFSPEYCRDNGRMTAVKRLRAGGGSVAVNFACKRIKSSTCQWQNPTVQLQRLDGRGQGYGKRTYAGEPKGNFISMKTH
jgi:hypothetical protein